MLGAESVPIGGGEVTAIVAVLAFASTTVGLVIKAITDATKAIHANTKATEEAAQGDTMKALHAKLGDDISRLHDDVKTIKARAETW